MACILVQLRGPPNPCIGIDEFAFHCNGRHTWQGFGTVHRPEHDHVVETFSSDGADQSLRVRILPR
jgi:hypothetical protein